MKITMTVDELSVQMESVSRIRSKVESVVIDVSQKVHLAGSNADFKVECNLNESEVNLVAQLVNDVFEDEYSVFWVNPFTKHITQIGNKEASNKAIYVVWLGEDGVNVLVTK